MSKHAKTKENVREMNSQVRETSRLCLIRMLIRFRMFQQSPDFKDLVRPRLFTRRCQKHSRRDSLGSSYNL